MKNWTYDIESLRNFFCVCFKSGEERHYFEISDWRNDFHSLLLFLRSNVSGLKGYNNLAYDGQIIHWLLLHDSSPSPLAIYNFSQHIISEEYPIYPEWQLTIPNLDIYRILHLDNKNRRVSLKWCEFMIDWHNIEDMPIRYDSFVQPDQVEEIKHYCWNDVEATEELFKRYQKEIELRVKLSERYQLNLMNASNSRIGSELTLKLYAQATGQHSSRLRKGGTQRFSIDLGSLIFPYIKFDSEAFSRVLEHFKKLTVRPGDDIKHSVWFKGVEYVYGLAGIHGSISNRIVECKEDEVLIDADVSSYWPSIAVVNNLYPEHLGPQFAKVYNEDIVEVRLREKRKKGDPIIIAGLKEAANSVYGKTNDKYSWLKDPQYAYTTTVNSQLMLSMLAERLSEIGEIIQVNTDGLTVLMKKQDEEEYYRICKEWEALTKLELEYANYKKMLVRDVNNYIAVYTDEKKKPKRKGWFEFENLPLHKTKSNLVSKIAIHDWFVKGTPIEETVYRHDNILDFCIGVRSKNDSKFIWIDKQGGEHPLSKTIRYFISNKGVVIKKRFTDGRTSYLNASDLKGRAYYQTMLNQYTETDAKKYDVNYRYYIKRANDKLHEIANDQQKLF